MAGIEERRAELLDQIPAAYSGVLHLIGVNLAALAAIAFAARRVGAPTWGELALLPGFLVFANLFEWWVHRGPLHHKTRFLGGLYERHTRSHHVVFTDQRMALAGRRELKLILFPPWVVPLLLAFNAPVALGLGLWRPNLGWLFVAAAFGYYLVYEWLHLCHHLPPESWIGRRRLVRLLRRHHWRHHAPSRMTQGNFNVSFPLADLLLGTTLPPGPDEG